MLQSIVEGMYRFWAQIIVLPKKVLKMVENKCRALLWYGSTLASKKAPVSWDNVCKTKCYGGLGLRNVYI